LSPRGALERVHHELAATAEALDILGLAEVRLGGELDHEAIGLADLQLLQQAGFDIAAPIGSALRIGVTGRWSVRR
jgi:hypothetical protein